MTTQADMPRGLILRLYLALTYLVPLIAPGLLRKRLARGKEHPERWHEKLGRNLAPRPKGTLIWLNAVGLGEVLSLRGLITRMAEQYPEAQFLVTSTTVTSAEVFAKNLPARAIHQFLPIDAPQYRRRFLDHFRPDLCIWVEQDIWPGFVSDLAKRSVPQCVVAARMDAKAFQSRAKLRSLYRNIYAPMALITSQDDHTATHLAHLGAADVIVAGSLKPSAPPLGHDADTLATIQAAIAGRTVWAVAPSHAEDETIALAAHETLRQTDPTALLIIAPRFHDRRDEIQQVCGNVTRSTGKVPRPKNPIWLFDTFGELGLVYRLSNLVLIGGTFSDIEGHNPWEAAILGTALTHGPRVANFATDFAALDEAGAARQIQNAADLAAILQGPSLHQMSDNATGLIDTVSAQTDDLARQLMNLVDHPNG